MKRLLCIVGSMNAGGAETFLMKVYRKLDHSSYQMDFAVATKEKGFYDDEICALGGKIYHIVPKTEGLIKNFLSIKRLVKSEKYNYVLRTSQHSLSALELLAAKLGGAKVRVFRSSNSNTTTGSKKQLIVHKLCSFMPIIFANVRIAPSTEAAEYMFGKRCINKKKAFILHNGIDTSVYKYSEQARIKIRNEFGINDDIFLVGHIGRFNQQKNHKYLIRIFQSMVDSYKNVILLLVGTGELEQSVKNLVQDLNLQDYVIFAGIRNDVPDILSALDCFIFPSLYEGMPNTVIEAQATGLRCLVSDTVTKEAKITENVAFKSINSAPADWVKDINISQYKKRAENSSAYFSTSYDINNVVKEFIELIFNK